jgi:hypothetical protein
VSMISCVTISAAVAICMIQLVVSGDAGASGSGDDGDDSGGGDDGSHVGGGDNGVVFNADGGVLTWSGAVNGVIFSSCGLKLYPNFVVGMAEPSKFPQALAIATTAYMACYMMVARYASCRSNPLHTSVLIQRQRTFFHS